MLKRLLSSTTYPIKFLLINSSDSVTPATGVVPLVQVCKDGSSTWNNVTGAVTEIGFGWYSLAGNATDRNTLGALLIHASGSTTLASDLCCEIVPYDPFLNQATATGVYDKTAYLISGTKTTLDSLNDITAASVWSVGTRSLTAGVAATGVYDKTGYSISGSKTTLDALNDVSQANIYAQVSGVIFNTKLDQIVYNPYNFAGRVDSAFGLIFNDTTPTVSESSIWAYATRSLTIPVTVSGNYDKLGYSISGVKTCLDALHNLDSATIYSQSYQVLEDLGLDHLTYATPISPFTLTSNSLIGRILLGTELASGVWNYSAGGPRSLTSAVAVSGNYDKAAYTISGTKTTLDALNDITSASVWSVGTRSLTTAVDATGVNINTLLSRIDVTLSTRVPSTGVPANFALQAIDSQGRVTVGSNTDKTGYSISGAKTTLDALNDITAASVWTVTTRGLTQAVAVSGNYDKTGYGITGSVAITGAVAVSGNYDKTGYTISGTKTTLDSLNDITAASVWAVASRSLTTGVTATGVYDKTGYTISGTKTTLDSLNDITASSVWVYASRSLTKAVVISGVKSTLDNLNDIAATSVWTSSPRTLSQPVVISGTKPTLDNLNDITAASIWAAGGRSLTAGVTATGVYDKTGYSISGTKTTLDSLNDPTPSSVWVYGTRNLTEGVTLATAQDVYFADITLLIGSSSDEYTVSWFKNGNPVTTAVGSPVLTVVNRNTGATLISSVAMTSVVDGVYKYDATSGSRLSSGDVVIISVAGTIDGSTRTWRRLSAYGS